jgi:rhodanese-related sulfurtransferase
MMSRTFLRALLIVLAGAALGLGFNAVSPRRIPYQTPPPVVLQKTDVVSLSEAQQLWASGAIFLDARRTDDYAAGHIPNALNLPVDAFAARFPQIEPMLTRDMPLVIYCDGEKCELSHQLQQRLRELGYPKCRVLVNAMTLWRRAGLPVTTGGEP